MFENLKHRWKMFRCSHEWYRINKSPGLEEQVCPKCRTLRKFHHHRDGVDETLFILSPDELQGALTVDDPAPKKGALTETK